MKKSYFGKLASALAKLPGGLQVAAGGVGLLAAQRVRGGAVLSIGKPGGVVNKVLGGGVQKVFVVNPHMLGSGMKFHCPFCNTYFEEKESPKIRK